MVEPVDTVDTVETVETEQRSALEAEGKGRRKIRNRQAVVANQPLLPVGDACGWRSPGWGRGSGVERRQTQRAKQRQARGPGLY